jgi:hypothetical protein
MNITWKAELPHWLLLVAMAGVAFTARSVADLRVPLQWGLSGEVNRYVEGPAAAFIPPLGALILYLVLLGYPGNLSGNLYRWLRLAVTFVLAVCYIASVLPALG